MNGDKTIELHLNLSEINVILEALGQMPYARVFQLINKIQQQAESQLQEVSSDTENRTINE